MPRMPFIGVRISWLMFAQEIALACVASSAFCLAARIASSRAFALGNVAPDRMDQPPAMLLDGRQQHFDREDLAVSAAVQPLEAEAAELQLPAP